MFHVKHLLRFEDRFFAKNVSRETFKTDRSVKNPLFWRFFHDFL